MNIFVFDKIFHYVLNSLS